MIKIPTKYLNTEFQYIKHDYETITHKIHSLKEQVKRHESKMNDEFIKLQQTIIADNQILTKNMLEIIFIQNYSEYMDSEFGVSNFNKHLGKIDIYYPDYYIHINFDPNSLKITSVIYPNKILRDRIILKDKKLDINTFK